MSSPEDWAGKRDTRWRDLERQAALLRPNLIGMTVEAAEAEIAEHPGLSCRISGDNDHVFTLDYRSGRIELHQRNGIVVTPHRPEPPTSD